MTRDILTEFRERWRQALMAHLVPTLSCSHQQQVIAKEIRQLDGPAKPLAMEILEIDDCSGLVVGMNGCVRKHENDVILAVGLIHAIPGTIHAYATRCGPSTKGYI